MATEAVLVGKGIGATMTLERTRVSSREALFEQYQSRRKELLGVIASPIAQTAEQFLQQEQGPAQQALVDFAAQAFMTDLLKKDAQHHMGDTIFGQTADINKIQARRLEEHVTKLMDGWGVIAPENTVQKVQQGVHNLLPTADISDTTLKPQVEIATTQALLQSASEATLGTNNERIIALKQQIQEALHQGVHTEQMRKFHTELKQLIAEDMLGDQSPIHIPKGPELQATEEANKLLVQIGNEYIIRENDPILNRIHALSRQLALEQVMSVLSKHDQKILRAEYLDKEQGIDAISQFSQKAWKTISVMTAVSMVLSACGLGKTPPPGEITPTPTDTHSETPTAAALETRILDVAKHFALTVTNGSLPISTNVANPDCTPQTATTPVFVEFAGATTDPHVQFAVCNAEVTFGSQPSVHGAFFVQVENNTPTHVYSLFSETGTQIPGQDLQRFGELVEITPDGTALRHDLAHNLSYEIFTDDQGNLTSVDLTGESLASPMHITLDEHMSAGDAAKFFSLLSSIAFHVPFHDADATPTPPIPTETQTPSLHTIDQGINELSHQPTQQELADLSSDILANHPEIKWESTFYNISGDPVNVKYDQYPFYYVRMTPEQLKIGAITETPDGVIVSMYGYAYNYQTQPLTTHLFFDTDFLTEHNLTTEKLQEVLAHPNDNSVFLTLPLAPDKNFEVPQERADEQTLLRQQYADVLEMLKTRQITIETLDWEVDVLLLLLTYSPNKYDPAILGDITNHIQKINSSLLPVVDMTWDKQP